MQRGSHDDTSPIRHAPTTTQCEPCALAKATKIISRRDDTPNAAEKPFERISLDFVPLRAAYNDDKWFLHITCRKTGYETIYTMARKSSFTGAVIEAINTIETRFKAKIRYCRLDGEKSLGDDFDNFIYSKGITLEHSAAETQAQNGYSERAGRVIVTMARALSIGSSIPEYMWPEAIKFCAYIRNMTPIQRHEWKTPHELVTGSKPDARHLKIWGCRAYPLIYHLQRLDKLAPRAMIGYLMGYDSTNIFRIWVPSRMRVFSTRDVTFNEQLFYDPAEIDVGHVLGTRVESLFRGMLPAGWTYDAEDDEASDSSDAESVAQEPSSEHAPEKPMQDETHLVTPEATLEATAERTSEQPVQPQLTAQERRNQNTAPRAADISANESEQFILPEGTKRIHRRRDAHLAMLAGIDRGSTYLYAFNSMLQLAPVPAMVSMPLMHRDQLPKEPRNWKEMLRHPMAAEFKLAATKEYGDLKRRGTFESVSRNSVMMTPLPLMWVFTYKFNKDGYLDRFKARLCVRGDLQVTTSETYAATLALCTFRTMIAFAAAFGLVLRQYDVVNAYANADIDEEIYCYPPEGFGEPDILLRLRKALYGLKQSASLWSNDLRGKLVRLGLYPVPGVEALYTDETLIVFFYVDDIIVACPPERVDTLDRFERQLMEMYDIKALGDAKWFLGIRIVRNEDDLRIWLCQDSFIQ